MKRIAKVLLWIAGSLFAVCVVFAVVLYITNMKNVRKAVEDQRGCDSRLDALRRDLPIGTPREEVLHYLHARGEDKPGPLSDTDEVYVDLGRIQSTSLVCNFFQEYARLSFVSNSSTGQAQRQLAQITTEFRGECL